MSFSPEFTFSPEAATELQDLVRKIARLRGATRTSQVLPREVASRFRDRYRNLPQKGRQELLQSLATSFTPSSGNVSAAYKRYESTMQLETGPGQVLTRATFSHHPGLNGTP